MEAYTHTIQRVETVASQAFLADDMKLATALRLLAKDLRLELDPLVAQLRAHISKTIADANTRRNARNQPHPRP